MFVQIYNKRKGNKVYRSAFLVESYRENGKVKHRHLANLSAMPDNLIAAIQRKIKGQDQEGVQSDDLSFAQGKACGGLLVIQEICKRLGITSALGKDTQARLALLQIMGRVLCQRSRLYIASQWFQHQALEEVLGISSVSEDALYANLDWLSQHQDKIEQKLFNIRHKNKNARTVYLYDVTSSYLEGTQNELAAYGYNRDKKKGKMQIVIGLLCDEEGYPVSVQVFEGNTQDTKTVNEQLLKLKDRFGVEQVVFVGDRGMIKSASIEEITEMKWYYITAITKPQIDKLLEQKVFQMNLFSEKLVEVTQDNIRYVLHRNPIRAEQINHSRMQRIEKIRLMVQKKNEYLSAHHRASVAPAMSAIEKRAVQLKVSGYILLNRAKRNILFNLQENSISEDGRLDGCYVIKSNLPAKLADTDTLHNRYKDLALVEQAFRTMKQAFEEIRPVYVRKKQRTRGHVLVCMLAYIVIKNVWEQCKDLAINQTNIFDALDRIQYIQYQHKNITIKTLPKKLSETQNQIIEKLNVKLPTYL